MSFVGEKGQEIQNASVEHLVEGNDPDDSQMARRQRRLQRGVEEPEQRGQQHRVSVANVDVEAVAARIGIGGIPQRINRPHTSPEAKRKHLANLESKVQKNERQKGKKI